MNIFYTFLKYITNNETTSKHELEFDIAFFIISTVALIVGIMLLFFRHTEEWIAFLVIEYIWSLDNMRHNR